MLKRILLYIFLIITVAVSAQENSRIISGTVSDKKTGEQLPGATVMLKGTLRGVVTDLDGKFTYQVNKTNVSEAVLVISFIGYKDQEVKLGSQTKFDIQLESSYNALNEVVVTSSYGTKKLKQDVVGSITNISAQDITVEAAVTSIDQLLEGQAAGLQIVSGEGIDAPAEINIRGLGSLPNSSVGTSTQPLIIVDGVILAEEIEIDGSFEFSDAKYAEDPSNPLSKIGVKDIESINVLKDAAAVSLYGADGANGVIIITTKGGTVGEFSVNFGAQSGFSTELNPIIYMNGEQYREVYNAYLESKGSDTHQWNGVSTDWHDLLNDNGFYQKYDLSVSGGKGKFDYRLSASYQDTEEPQIENNLKRINSNISLGYTSEKLRISWKLSPSYSLKNSPNTLADFALPPDKAPYLTDGNYNNDFPSYGNPIAVAHQNLNEKETLGLRSSFSINYKILDNLSLSTMLGNDISNKRSDRFYSGENQTGIFNDGQGRRLINDRDASAWNWNAVLNYNKSFNSQHNFDATLGVETRLEGTKFSKAQGTGFTVFDSPQDISLANEQDYDSDSDERTGRSGFTQLNYNYNKKYFLLVNARVDQSSAFGGDNNTSFNSAVGASWIISKEDFFKNIRGIEFLKLRSSYGNSGNSRIGSYSAKGLYNLYDTEGSRGYNGWMNGYAYPGTTPNPNLGWESNYKFDAAIEMTTNFRLGITLDYYYDNIKDLIVSRDIPLEIGYNTVQINGATMYNKGWELSLRYTVFDRSNFRWDSNLNASTLKNKITSLKALGSEASSTSGYYTTQVGKSASAIWGYNFAGVDPATGRELYNIDGNIVDHVTFKQKYHESEYLEIIGNSQPDLYGGLSNNFTFFKNLKLRVSMSYSIGGEKLIDDDKIDKYNILSYSNMGVNAYYQAWREAGGITGYGAISERGTVPNASKYLYSTSHIKLSSVSLSYRVPLNKVSFIKSLSFNATGTNLYYFFFQDSPEGQNGITEFYKTYSDMRSFTFGLNASF